MKRTLTMTCLLAVSTSAVFTSSVCNPKVQPIVMPDQSDGRCRDCGKPGVNARIIFDEQGYEIAREHRCDRCYAKMMVP